MHERDLRRQALESGKTVSRKARSRQLSAASSKASSTANSRAASRNASRHPSDDEDGFLSDSTAWSAASRDELLILEEIEGAPDAWEDELNNLIETIITRKRQSGEKLSAEAREETIRRYSLFLTARYASDVVEDRIGELLPAIIKSMRAEESEGEVIVALKALMITLITVPSESIYDSVEQVLKRIISDSDSVAAKVAAIHTLATATFYGGASGGETEEIMAYFLEIIESDGFSINSHDEGSVVTAALEEWGFLATQLDDLEDIAEDAAEAFVEQLDSSDVNVQISAGENIALLYEQSHSLQEEGEEVASDDEVNGAHDQDFDPDYNPSSRLVKRYAVYRREDQLKHTLERLASTGTKSINRKDKKSLRSNFSDIRQTVENPRRGPGYRTTLSKDTGMWHGSSLKVRIRGHGEMKIDTWWKLHRLKALRRILHGGFITHYEENQVVFDTLPIIVRRNAHWRH